MPKEQLKTLTEQMYYVLLALKRERCGVDITEYVLLRTDGRLRLGPGTLYSMLSKFEDEQLIEKTRVEGRRQWYQITEKGMQMVLQEIQRMQQMIDDGIDIIHHELGGERDELPYRIASLPYAGK